MLDATADDMIDVAQRYILDAMEKDKTSKVIFGAKNENLDIFVSRDWKIERFIEGLSLKPQNYNHSSEEVESW